MARLGLDWQGGTWRGRAGLGKGYNVAHSILIQGVMRCERITRHGRAGQGLAWRGRARHGKGCNQRDGDSQSHQPGANGTNK